MDGIVDTAACPQDIQIARALELERDLILSIAAEHHVRMPVHQSGRHEVALRINDRIRLIFAARQGAVRGNRLDDAVLRENCRLMQLAVFALLSALVCEAADRRLQGAYIFYQ